MRNEILALQKEMKKHGLTMYLVPTGDEHRSEYVSEYYKFRAYLSGFTGSAGTLLVTEDKCLLWTDGRYFVQAAKELENSGIMLMKSGEMDVPGRQAQRAYRLGILSSSQLIVAPKGLPGSCPGPQDHLPHPWCPEHPQSSLLSTHSSVIKGPP